MFVFKPVNALSSRKIIVAPDCCLDTADPICCLDPADHADCSNPSVRAGRSFAEFLVGYLSRNGSEVAGIIPAKDKKMIAWLIPKYNTNFIPGSLGG